MKNAAKVLMINTHMVNRVKAPNKDRSEVLEESSYIILDQGAAKLHVGHQTLRINRPAKNQML